MTFAHLRRGGAYYRVCDPSWSDPSDTSYSRRDGGRWNPAGPAGRPGFGALYLNRTIDVARANARRHVHQSFGVAIEDLLDERRPDLQHYDVTESDVVDAVTPTAVHALGLSAAYPTVPREPCQAVAEAAYAQDEHGIAAMSAVAIDAEELVVFDRDVTTLTRKTARVAFAAWY